MSAAVVDLVSDSSDEEKEDGKVEAKSQDSVLVQPNGGKRKIEASKKEPNRKNPCPRNGKFRNTGLKSADVPVRRVSPGLEEQQHTAEAEDEVIVWREERTTKCVVVATTKASAKDYARAVSASPVSRTVVSPPPRIWWDSDNAIITYEVLSPLKGGNNLLMTNVSSVPHIQQTDKWSCGFRNIQMLLSGLIPLLPATHPYFQALANIYCQEVPAHMLGSSSPLLILPSLTQLQHQLEASWRDGFDQNGADHFKHSVVGRPSKIGAIEVGYIFTYWWLDCCVAQFIKCYQSRRLLPPFVYRYYQGRSRGQQAKKKASDCLQWAESGKFAEEKEGPNPDTGTTVLPLYLQWKGHSVTVVGIEPPSSGSVGSNTDWSQWNLLVFDPGRVGARLKSSNTTTAPFRLPCRELFLRDCQLVVSGWEPLTPELRMERKLSAPVVTAASDFVTEYAARG